MIKIRNTKKKKIQVVGGDEIFYVAHIYYDVKKKFFFSRRLAYLKFLEMVELHFD